MSCCCTEDNRIIIIKKNDTDFNNGNLVEFNITSDIYNVADFTAELILGDIKREFNDLSYGIINFNLSKEETVTLPYGNIDGVMNFIDSQGRVATISSIIPFRVVGIVENDAIKTSDVDYTINVEQGGKNIFNIDVKTNVSVRVGTVETLPAGSSAYVENVGTPTGVVLNFGIPQGIQGEQGIRGEQGIQGEKGDTGSKGEKGDKGDTGATGEAATIQVGTVTTLNPSEPAYVQNVGTEQNAIFNFGIPKGDAGSGANADFSDITGSPYDCDALAIALNEKQDTISDLSTIRSGAEAGATALQPNTSITGATKCKITYDSKGLVTGGADLQAVDIPDLSYTYQTKLTSSNKLSTDYISGLSTVATSGSYTDLSNKPTIPDAQIQSDWTQSDNTKVDYIKNKPTLATVATSGSYNDLINKPTIPPSQVNSDWNASSGVAQILNKPTLATVATSGSYTDLSNKPTIPDAQIQSDWTQSDNTKVDYIKNKPTLATVATSGSYNDLINKPTIPPSQVNSDWNASSGVAQILNKPTLATVATSGSYNDLSNKPSIPQALSDIAVAGDNVTFERQAQINYTVTGNPSISTDYVVSGFSSSNFLRSTFASTTYNTLELVVKITTGDSVSGTVFGRDSNRFISIGYDTCSLSSTGSGYNIGSINYMIPINSTLWLKLTHDGSTYIYSVSTDGSTWNEIGSVASTEKLYSGVKPYLGGYTNSGSSTVSDPFNGSIDLTETYIKIDGEFVWRAVELNSLTSINATVPSITVDQTYNSASSNAQSGKAVASALSVKQNISNLVTSVSSSSTDSQYPSAKCLYDFCGNITALINAL